MRLTFRRALLIALLPPLVLAAAGANATSKPPPSPVVLRAGATTLTLAELQAEIEATLPFQLASLGSNDAQIRRAYVEQVALPRLLLAEEARARNSSETLAVKQQVNRALVQALQESERAHANTAVTDAAVKSYFDEHRAELSHPERIRVFRLLVADRAAAQKLLEKARTIKDMAEWRALVRDHSIDQATRLRGGDLGFVHPNGDTEVPSLRATRELFDAAAKVRDGELVPELVAEGKHFGVVWRRGSLAAVEPQLADHAPRIRQLLIEDRTRQALDALVAQRQSDVERGELALLDELELHVPADPRLPASALLPPAPVKARPALSAGEAGLR
ncbi:MAG TPA: peptidyl-prolyl cis-trans isomerase [Polyangiaceae bacterium]